MLTRAGERLLPHAGAVLAALVAESDSACEPFCGTFRLGIIPTIAPYLLPVALRGLTQAFPSLTMEVNEERTAALLTGLQAGRIDAAILAVPVEARGLAVDRLYEEDFVLVSPRGHQLSTRDSAGPGELRDLDVLLLEEGHCLRDQTLDICTEAGIFADSATRAASLTTLAQLVSAGMGVTVLPETAVAVEVKRAGLTVTGFDSPAPRRRIALVYRESAGRSAEYTAIAGELRRVVRTRRLPVRVTVNEALAC